MNLKYYLGAFLSFPLLPIMYFQGKKIKASVPRLPEAEGTKGIATIDGVEERALHLIAVGESTIAGVGVSTHEEGFTGTLAKQLAKNLDANINWRVYARSGYTAARVTKKLIPKIEEKDIDVLVIGLGGNDAFTLNSPGKWRNDVQQLIETLRSKYPTTTIIFNNMPPIKEFPAFTPLIKFTVGNLVEILGQTLNELVENYENVFYFSEIISLENWIDKIPEGAKRSDFFSDGVHPSKLTYQTWAIEIANRMADNPNIRELLEEKL